MWKLHPHLMAAVLYLLSFKRLTLNRLSVSPLITSPLSYESRKHQVPSNKLRIKRVPSALFHFVVPRHFEASSYIHSIKNRSALFSLTGNQKPPAIICEKNIYIPVVHLLKFITTFKICLIMYKTPKGDLEMQNGGTGGETGMGWWRVYIKRWKDTLADVWMNIALLCPSRILNPQNFYTF